MLKQLFCAGTTTIALLGICNASAIASSYASASGNTQLVFREIDPDPNANGFYFTKSNGGEWKGSFQVKRIEQGALKAIYSGTFEDFQMGPGDRRICQGEIFLNQSYNRGPVNKTAVRWTITGGQNCPAPIGEVYTADLVETLPKPDSRGDYTPENSTTMIGETNGNGTWPLWEVIASDGKLNCRSKPDINSKVVFTYKSSSKPSDRIKTYSRGGGTIVTATDGTTWMEATEKKCYVRANNRTIKPVTFPF
jgi:hypothetical protein